VIFFALASQNTMAVSMSKKHASDEALVRDSKGKVVKVNEAQCLRPLITEPGKKKERRYGDGMRSVVAQSMGIKLAHSTTPTIKTTYQLLKGTEEMKSGSTRRNKQRNAR
jgi:SRSO17 transposase